MASVTDPVCGMAVDPVPTAASHEYAGQKYWFCSSHCQQKFDAAPQQYVQLPVLAEAPAPAQAMNHQHGAESMTVVQTASQGGKAKDPVCGMVVDKTTALKTERGGRSYYFCSESCLRTFESPESELKAMKTRVLYQE